ncbi:NAD(P)H-dependent oxidoreductase [Snodgrassella gandavensis]|uniref:NAD(P)H-dependent oxidoreductase n=1 Tax=Snodgrassella gandavensis TaxID=2946698 RepID=UPI001EF5A979|nr:NAD(P)H-dependent oxidoreductase [Snodgrassella gandavensis]
MIVFTQIRDRDFDHSVANKAISAELVLKMSGLEIRNIHHLYPDYQIDIGTEQTALLRHKLIILQYPMYWFKMPAILKIWFDQVFSYQFAYGFKEDKLKNKKILVSMTVGPPEENFKLENHFLINDFLQAVKKSAEYAQMDYLGYIALYGVSPVAGIAKEERVAKTKQHSLKLFNLIQQYR